MKQSENERDAGVLSNPLSFLRSGRFYWGDASLGDRGGYGNYWFLRSTNTAGSNDLYFNSTSLNPQDGSYHAYGFAVRCESYMIK